MAKRVPATEVAGASVKGFDFKRLTLKLSLTNALAKVFRVLLVDWFKFFRAWKIERSDLHFDANYRN